MKHIKIAVILSFCLISVLNAEEISESTPTVESSSIAATGQSVKISKGMWKKIKDFNAIASQEKGQNDAALERLGEKLSPKMALIPLNEELIAVIKNKDIDWRVRYLLIGIKSYTAGSGKIEKYSDDFVGIMKDKGETERVRAVAAMIMLDLSKKNDKVKKAFVEVVKAEDTPNELLRAAMSVVGYGGVDDADVLMKLTEHAGKDFNDIGINLNAVRALGESKDHRAFGYLIKIFDESKPDSFFNDTAINTMWKFIRDPAKRAQTRPVIVPRLLKLLDDRSRLGASRDDAAKILGALQVQEAVEPIMRWFLPSSKWQGEPVEGGGGHRMDIITGADILTQLGDKRTIPMLEKFIENFPNDSRWLWEKKNMTDMHMTYPNDHPDYKYLQKCLKALKADRVKDFMISFDKDFDRKDWLKKVGMKGE